MGNYRYEVKRRMNNEAIPTPSTSRADDGFDFADASISDVIRQLDAKNYGTTPLFEEFNGLTAAQAADLTTAVSTKAGGNWLAVENNAGTVAVSQGTVTLTTDAANNDYAMLGATNYWKNGDAVATNNSGSSKLVWEAIVQWVGTDVSTGNGFVGLINQAAPAWVADANLEATNTPIRLGFAITNAAKTIDILNCNATDVTITEAAIASTALNAEFHLKMVYDFTATTPSIAFYNAGVLVGTHTALLPATGSKLSPYFAIETTTGALAMTVRSPKVYYV